MSNNSIRFYCYNFILKNRLQNLLISTIIIAIIIKEFAKNTQQNISYKINHPKGGYDVQVSDIVLFCLFFAIYTIITPAIELMGSKMEGLIVADAFTHLYRTFLSYRYSDWPMKIKGEFYSLAFRRSKGVSGFFRNLFIDILDNGAYIIIKIINLQYMYTMGRHTMIGLFLVLVFPMVMNILTIFRNKLLRLSNEAYDISEKKIKDIFLNYEMIQSYNMLEYEIEKYNSSMGEWKKWFILYWILNNFIDAAQGILKTLCQLIMYTQVSERIDSREIPDQLKIFNSTLKRVCSLAQHSKTLIECTENIRNSKLDALDEKRIGVKIPKKSFDSNVEAVNTAKYYGDNLIFQNINLKISKGKKIAITGPNGSGKSSFVKALLGIERFTGDIRIDGLGIESIDEKDFRRLISYVPQDSYLFEGTVYENITCFDRKIPSEEVIRIVTAFGMHEEMKSIGYRTMLVEKGRNISSAQRQKICFLRAVIKDTPIIVFDEITSEMDKNYESRLIDTIMSRMCDKTVIMIIHNLEMLGRFDEVIFFNKNTAIGNVTYDELIENNPDFNKYRMGQVNQQ